ncbi:hypothetical protein [Glaesserella parasuis]|uniref:hypothetical protein n=1 Tax=Glaesserella parasuis TaxID=738 RepID=UPI001365D5CE|nr:hypothetical protein [Glaesserella parasuis]MDG6319132.1 hypothetical protein [Glaesserella parasuis]MDG6366212.1 hypothetical protein [Glaesserella parasuis]MDG6372411.1 hypothetical protein [Glaesserella parasuis]MDG6444488.1 hypothetical protein [Glaesserella parasuis]MDO9732808.1 hypothetical protein [Glaesserella parasuis]
MIILQAQPMVQVPHNAVFAVVETHQKPLREVPALSPQEYKVFANVERYAQQMTEESLMRAMVLIK